MTMKKMAYRFVLSFLILIAVVPAINLGLKILRHQSNTITWNKAALYSLDFALPWISNIFYQAGISLAPDQVVIGKDDWLYLGDRYANELSVTRTGASPQDIVAVQKIGIATKAWADWMHGHGVQAFKIMLFPTKQTIYPEFLPAWVKPATHSAADTLLSNTAPGVYVDTRAAVKAAKEHFSVPLYYKTDSHWNSLAAWIAFAAFTKELNRVEAGMQFFAAEDAEVAAVNERIAGDLANFLGMTAILHDKDVYIKVLGTTQFDQLQIPTEQYDFNSGKLLASEGNPQIATPRLAMLIKSKKALNQKRVLWLHDSYGVAVTPYMAATFSETLHLHYDATTPELLADLVQRFKPDFVFISVVERQARMDWFSNLPPKH
ncbi:MAG: hypothetical protein K2P84_03445 [Undibacterium sp.]|nr:hypothetical protein [Undibacterium sp.]